MKKEKKPLESYMFYRFGKVLYVFGLIWGFFLVILIGWSMKPIKTISTDFSYIQCKNNSSYSLKDIGMLYEKTDIELNEEQISNAKIACEYGLEKIGKMLRVKNIQTDTHGILDTTKTPFSPLFFTLLDELPGDSISTNYEIVYQYRTQGSWRNVVAIWGIGFALVYLAVEILRRTFLYVLFNKKPWSNI